jgi:hypothetical protein
MQDSSAAEHPTISLLEYDSDSDYSTSFCSTDDYSDDLLDDNLDNRNALAEWRTQYRFSGPLTERKRKRKEASKDDDDDDDEMLLEERDNFQSLTHESNQGERERNETPNAEDIKAWYKEWIANPENLKEPEPETPCLPRAPSHLVPGTEEYFEYFTLLRKYRRAQRIFDLDSSGQGFRNPFTERRRGSEGCAPRSSISPKSKTTTEMRGGYRSAGEQESGGIYNPFEGSEVESSNPSSSRTSSPDLIILGSVSQHFVTIQEPTHSFSSQTAQLCSAENELLTDQAFQSAAADFLNPINVELLVAEHQDLGYTITNNDEHPAKSGYRIRHDFSPHESREGCYCHWCQADRDNDAGEMPEPHDPNAWCHCPTCSIFRLDQQLAEVQTQLGTEMQTHEAQQSRMQERLQRVHSLRKVREELMERRQKIAGESKTAEEQKRRASNDVMEYQFDISGPPPPARERRGDSGQEDKEKRYGGLFEWVGRQLRDSDEE